MKFDHVVISAGDLAASALWYAAVLGAIGFRRTRDHVWVNDHGEAVDVRAATAPDHGYVRGAPGVNHLGFAAPSRAAVEAVAATVAAAGFEVPAIQSFGEARALFLKDPDGLRIEVAHEPGEPG